MASVSAAVASRGRRELSVSRALLGVGFVALLAWAAAAPPMQTSGLLYPTVQHAWVCAPFGALFLLPFLDVRRPLRLVHLDALVFVSLAAALVAYDWSRTLPIELAYPPLLYLGVRMVLIARARQPSRLARGRPAALWMPQSWLLAGVLVLIGVHIHWALSAQVADVGAAGVHGALDLLHGRPLYGADPGLIHRYLYDVHWDTYGPFNYEAYVPFAALFGQATAARLVTLSFDLLTALLLFVLGRRMRGPSVGALLTYAWLAFPFTLYCDAFAFNDAIVAATVVGVLLASASPARRGVLTALAALTKLSPLALVPLVATHARPDRDRRRPLWAFAAGFGLMAAALLAPALTHSSPATFVERTLGYQSGRPSQWSIWALYGGGYAPHAPWVLTTSKILHGAAVGLTGGLAVTLALVRRRPDTVGLAAASGAVLIALLFSDSYYAFNYVLWFAPLVIVALLCHFEAARPATARNEAATHATGRRRPPLAGECARDHISRAPVAGS